MYEDGLPPKRMKSESNGFGSGARRGSYGYTPKPERTAVNDYVREERENNVLLFTVLNPQYPITVDVMNTICAPNGKVLRVVVFKKQGVQAMVEFETIDDAVAARQALNGADIYSGCCTLKIEYARTSRLNVTRNDQDSWDYTNANLGQDIDRRNALLPDPGPYGGEPRGHSRDPYDRYSARSFSPPRERYPPHEGYGPPRGDGYGGRMSHEGGDPYARRRPPPDEGYGRRPPPEMYHGSGEPAGGMSTGMGMQGAVLMTYGLNTEKMNCQKIFNLFCQYGNVVRVKFLKSKEGSAMVQMGDPAAMERAKANLTGALFFDGKLQSGYSKQLFLQDVPNPIEMPDGTSSFMDFMGSRLNRYQNPDAASKNRVHPPSKTLYYWNAPVDWTEESIKKIFEDEGVQPPVKIKIFPVKSDKSSSGLIEWDGTTGATEALISCNHIEIPNPKGKYPYILKLCFSGNVIVDTPYRGQKREHSD